MSVIATLIDEGGGTTWIGSDAIVSIGNLRQVFGPKWILSGPWAIGVAGHLRAINVIQRHADALEDAEGPFELALRLRDLFKADGFREDAEAQGPAEFGQAMLLARPDGAWIVGSEFSIVPVPEGQLWAEGTGRELAIGTAHALRAADSGLPCKEVMTRAINTAIALDVGCGGAAWVHPLSRR
jgi:ATP-dependent protease HslVU (ClpYQ) peptidase subunit